MARERRAPARGRRVGAEPTPGTSARPYLFSLGVTIRHWGAGGLRRAANPLVEALGAEWCDRLFELG
jgi:hypothetical protein